METVAFLVCFGLTGNLGYYTIELMPKRRLCFVLATLSMCFLFSTKDISAQAPTPYPVAKDQSTVQSAYNSLTDQFFSVWGDCRNISLPLQTASCNGYYCGLGCGDSGDVYGQIIGSDGSCFGGNLQIAGGNIGHQLPGVSYNPDGNEYLVAWQGLKEDFVLLGMLAYGAYQERGYDIYGQRISGLNGAKIGGFIKIAPNPIFKKSPCFGHVNNPALECDDHQWHPRIAYSTRSHRYMVVWHDGRTRAQFYDLYTSAQGDQTTFKDIYGQIVNADGSLYGSNFPVTIDPTNTDKTYNGNARRIQEYSEIAYDSENDRFLAVWEDDRDGSGSPHPPGQRYDCLNLNIYGGFFDTSGHPVVKYDAQNRPTNFQISGLSDAERYPKIAYNPVAGEYFVVWQAGARPTDANCAAGNYSGLGYVKVYGRRLNNNGDPLGDLYVIDSQAVLHDRYMNDSIPPQANVAVNISSGRFLVSWQKSTGIKGRWIEMNGTMGPVFDLAGGIEENRIAFRGRSPWDLYMTGLKRPYPWPNNFAIYTYKLGQMPYFVNCPAEGQPPPVTPTPTSNCPRGDTGNLDCDTGGKINSVDRDILLASWSPVGPVPTPAQGHHPADLNGDGLVNEKDLSVVLANWMQ